MAGTLRTGKNSLEEILVMLTSCFLFMDLNTLLMKSLELLTLQNGYLKTGSQSRNQSRSFHKHPLTGKQTDFERLCLKRKCN